MKIDALYYFYKYNGGSIQTRSTTKITSSIEPPQYPG